MKTPTFRITLGLFLIVSSVSQEFIPGAQAAPIDNCVSVSSHAPENPVHHGVCPAVLAASTPEDRLSAFLETAGGCLTGGGKGVINTLESIAQFAKLLLVEAPSWAWEKTSQAIQSLWSSAPDAVSGASQAAEANLQAHASIYGQAKAYAEAFRNFLMQTAATIENEWFEFACMSAPEQARVTCQLVTEVFLGVVSPKKFLSGAAWASDLAKASMAFIRQAKVLSKVGGLSAVETMRIAAERMGSLESRGAELRRVGRSRIVEYTNVRGEKYLKIEEPVKSPEGKTLWVGRELPLDRNTGAIDANFGSSREMLNQVVESGSNRSTVVFIDVNNLGKVNYFKTGTAGGDTYLKAVGEVVRKNLRSNDLFFKLGGDELMVVLDSSDPAAVQAVSQRIVKGVNATPEARAIFRSEIKIRADFYREASRAKNIQELGPEIRKLLTQQDLEAGSENWDAFKSDLLKGRLADLYEQAKLRPSISIGAKVLKPGDTLESSLAAAENQAKDVKIRYKRGIGLDTTKYGPGASTDAPIQPKLTILPEVQPPIE